MFLDILSGFFSLLIQETASNVSISTADTLNFVFPNLGPTQLEFSTPCTVFLTFDE